MTSTCLAVVVFIFPDVDGCFGGPPPDGSAPVAELNRLADEGAEYLIIASPAFWWLDHYHQLSDHLETSARRLAATDRFIVYQLDG